MWLPLVVALVCVLASAASLIVGTVEDSRAIQLLGQGHSLSGTDVMSQTVEQTVPLEAGRTYLVIGSALWYNAKAQISVTSADGQAITVTPGEGKVRDMSLVGSFTVPATDDYTVTIVSNGMGIHAYVVDEAIRGADTTASVLLLFGFVFIGIALILFIVWAVKRGNYLERIDAARRGEVAGRREPPWTPPDLTRWR